MRNSNTLKVLLFTRDISNNPQKLSIYARITVNEKEGRSKARGTEEDMVHWNLKSRLRPIEFLLYAYLPEHYKKLTESMRKSWG